MCSSPLVPADAAKRLSLPDGYRGVPGHYDEAVDSAGTIRPAWQAWAKNCLGATAEELQHRDDACRRLLRDYGVTYTPPGADLEQDRPWLLDSWPVLIGDEEWERLSRGVSQRARLLNRVLADISGPRELLLSGELPPEIVFANPAFLRAAAGIEPPRDVYLGFYAIDLARSPDGRWWVVSDRTDTPAGAGYALENRIVLSRVYPDLIRDLNVQRLARYFSETRDGLLAMAPAGVEEPRVVILTPGPYSSTYFEQAYLARYLGFSLVEGGDLTIRDQGVFLKTLSGLLPVHVIVRRVASAYCDPLELREDSLLGVPGLLQAVRAGRVVIANSIGAGVVETPALLPFLPGLCRHLLGEELLIPPVATWWCGQKPELDLVLKHLDDLVIKRAYPRRDAPSVRVTPASRAKIEAEIRARPHLYVGQEFVELSTAPSFQDGRLQPRHLMLRLFATATGDGNYRVMPGALTRVAATAESVIMSELTGGGTKDAWVLGTEPADNTTLLPTGGHQAALSRAGFVLPSRLADDLFWLGRYLERVEFGGRLARCLLHRLTDQTEHGQLNGLASLLELFAAHGRLGASEIQSKSWSPEHLEALLRRAVFDETNPGALVADIGRVHRIGVSVRDRLAVDAWRILHAMHEDMKAISGRKRQAADAQLAALDSLLAQVSTFSGQSMDGMTRDKGWHFLEIGRRLERAADLCDLLRHGMAVAGGDEAPRLLAMLETANSAMTYRSRYVFGPEPAPVLDLLLADEGNPRSAVFQLASLYEHLKAIQPTRKGEPKSTEVQMVTTIFSDVRLVDVDSLVLVVRNGRRQRLVDQLRRITRAMENLSQTLTRTYLTHVLAARPLGGGKP
jgi:uncharacterized circularly permuted ATP-grasp superfamily protein/uncharacterized alpha-E superfamily protein